MLFYPRSDTSTEWPLADALDRAGVFGDVRGLISSTTHPDNIRNTFWRWTCDSPVANKTLCNLWGIL